MRKASREIFTQSWNVLEVLLACRHARRGGRRRRGSWSPAERRGSRRPRGKSRHRRPGRSRRRSRHSSRGATRFERRRNGHAGILAERGDIIGRRAESSVLEIDEADAREALALAEPEQVRRMDVEQHPALLGRGEAVEQRAPRVASKSARPSPAVAGRWRAARTSRRRASTSAAKAPRCRRRTMHAAVGQTAALSGRGRAWIAASTSIGDAIALGDRARRRGARLRGRNPPAAGSPLAWSAA